MKKLLSLILAFSVLFSVVPLSVFTGFDWSDFDFSGLYSVANAEEINDVSPKLGDVDGDRKVSSADARLVLRASVGLEQFTESQKSLADVDFDNKVTSADARLVLRASVGLEYLKEKENDDVFQIVENEYVENNESIDTVYKPEDGEIQYDESNDILFYNDLINIYLLNSLESDKAIELANLVSGTIVGELSGSVQMLQIKIQTASFEEICRKCNLLMEQEQVLYATYDMPYLVDSSAFDSDPWNADPSVSIADKNNENNPAGNDWWAEAIGAYSAWQFTDNNTQQVKVGVIDSGFYYQHPDLKGQISFLSNYKRNTPENHGTHVAGLIAAKNNVIGMRGTCVNSKMYCVDWSPSGKINYLSTAEYITITKQLIDNGVKVINNSWGNYVMSKDGFTQALYGKEENDMKYLLEYFAVHVTGAYDSYMNYVQELSNRTGIQCMLMMIELLLNNKEDYIIIQAAGNGYDNAGPGIDTSLAGFYCAIDEELFNLFSQDIRMRLKNKGITYDDIASHKIIVGAVENQVDAFGNYKMTNFSNFGSNVDICAPGKEIYSTVYSAGTKQYTYDFMDGTSMAAPIVSGSAALLWAIDPSLSVSEIKETLLQQRRVQSYRNGSRELYPMLNIEAARSSITTSSVSGVVKKASTDAALDKVTLVFTDIGTNSIYSTETDYSGTFSIELPYGDYALKINEEGFDEYNNAIKINEKKKVFDDAIYLLIPENINDYFDVGDGTKENPFQITNIEQLNALRYAKNPHYYILTNDIIFPNDTKWIPVGTNEQPFTGCLDGNNHSISNLNIECVTDGESQYCGLFAVTNGGEISNLVLDNAQLNYNGGSDILNTYSGVLVAYNKGKDISIDNCCLNYILNHTTNGNASNAKASSSSIAKADNCVGGIIGYSNSIQTKIQNIATNDNIDVWIAPTCQFAYSYVGGIVGYCRDIIINNLQRDGDLYFSSNNCANHCSLGGLVGYCESITISDSIVNSKTTGINRLDESFLVDAPTGFVTGGAAGSSSHVDFNNVSITGDIISYSEYGSNYVGGLVGQIYSSSEHDIQNCSYAGNIFGRALRIRSTAAIGGFFGKINGHCKIENSSVDSNINSRGYDRGKIYVGGFIGLGSEITLLNSEASGTLEGTAFAGAYVDIFIGGIVGKGTIASVKNTSYNENYPEIGS